jgi:hypothetical protein
MMLGGAITVFAVNFAVRVKSKEQPFEARFIVLELAVKIIKRVSLHDSSLYHGVPTVKG